MRTLFNWTRGLCLPLFAFLWTNKLSILATFLFVLCAASPLNTRGEFDRGTALTDLLELALSINAGVISEVSSMLERDNWGVVTLTRMARCAMSLFRTLCKLQTDTFSKHMYVHSSPKTQLPILMCCVRTCLLYAYAQCVNFNQKAHTHNMYAYVKMFAQTFAIEQKFEKHIC